MNIYNLAVPAALLAISLSACTPISYEAAPSTPRTPDPSIDYSCEPLLDSDWTKVAVPPPLVLEAQAKSSKVTSIEVDGLYVTYYRDCTSMVRSSMSARYPDGLPLGTTMCEGSSMKAYIIRHDSDAGVSPEVTLQAEGLLSKLRDSNACSTKHITLIGT